MRTLIAIFTFGLLSLVRANEPLMIKRGTLVLSKTFDEVSDVDKGSIKFNKETQHKVEGGVLKAIPPVIAYAGTGANSKWAKSSFSRVNFPGLPKDYICRFRIKIYKPKDKKLATKAKAYFDMGHRCIRTTLTAENTTLLLENHLVGKGAKETSKILDMSSEIKLEFDQWIDVITEVKGNESLIQINGYKLYGSDALISKDRANTFNIDILGAGYELDKIEIWKAADYLSTWKNN